MTRHPDERDEQETPARVIVGVDPSDNSLRAAAWAAQEASAHGVPSRWCTPSTCPGRPACHW